MGSDFAWLTEHSIDIDEKYRGRWIAVLNGEIVGVGNTATEAAKEADSKHDGAKYVLEYVDDQAKHI